MIIWWIWRISLITACQKEEKTVVEKSSHKNKNAEVRWILMSPKKLFSFSFFFRADYFTLKELTLSFSNYILHCLLFHQLLKFHVTSWLAKRGSKSGSSHTPHTMCFLLTLFTLVYILRGDSSDLMQNKMTISLIKSKRKSCSYSKGFLESLLQIYILVLSNRLKITGLLYSSPILPLLLYSLNWYECIVLANSNWVISHRNSSLEPFFFLLYHLCFMMGIRELINVPLPGMEGYHDTIFYLITYILEITAKSRIYIIFTWKTWPLLKSCNIVKTQL